ncbi:MAG TPA: hypothetical protein VJ455_01995 [Ignavibacteria bacterium]|nr:hypothetical protein [Ignavibacteria bacterium]
MMTFIEKINGWHPVILVVGSVGISFIDIVELWMRIACMAIAGGYGIWKWVYEYRKSKKENV